MKSDYDGAGRGSLLDALIAQRLVDGDAALARDIARRATLLDIREDQEIIAQGEIDNDIYFILTGKVGIVSHGRAVTQLGAGEHVGEMSAINPRLPRSASVIGLERGVLAKLSERDFMKLADAYPRIWQLLAQESARRLYDMTVK